MDPRIGRLEDFKPGELVQAKRQPEVNEWALVAKDSDEKKALLFFSKAREHNQQLAYIKPQFVVGTGLGIQITMAKDFFRECTMTDLNPEDPQANKLILVDDRLYFLVEKGRKNNVETQVWFFVALDGSVIPYGHIVNNHYGMAFVPKWSWGPSEETGVEFVD